MHRRRNTGYLLTLLALATGLVLMVRPAPLPTAAQDQPDLRIHLYRDPAETDPFAPGNEITYQIYFINWSADTANDVLRIPATI